MGNRRTLSVEVECSEGGCIAGLGSACQYLEGAECTLFNKYLRTGLDGSPLRCDSCLEYEASARMLPVFGMELEGVEDAPVARACVVVSIDECSCGIILADPAPPGEQRTVVATLAVDRDAVGKLVESLRQAVVVCEKREALARGDVDA